MPCCLRCGTTRRPSPPLMPTGRPQLRTSRSPRSLPDPKLVFEAYIGDALTSLTFGPTADIPGPCKLCRPVVPPPRRKVAPSIFNLNPAVRQTAFGGGEKLFICCIFWMRKLQANRQTLGLLAAPKHWREPRTKSGGGHYSDVLRAQTEQEKLKTETENLEKTRVGFCWRNTRRHEGCTSNKLICRCWRKRSSRKSR